MINKFKYLAKPTGITLREHCDNLFKFAMDLIKNNEFPIQKYEKMFGVNLIPSIFNIIECHDDGKSHEKWAKACEKDYELFKNSENLYHLKKANIRHEFISVLMNNNLSDEEKLAISCHHGKLLKVDNDEYRSKLTDHTYNNLEFINFFNKINAEINELFFENNIDYLKLSYKWNFLRAVLQIIDKISSYNEVNEEKIKIKKFNWSYPSNFDINDRPIQKRIYDYDDIKDIYFIRAYTGSGKTNAGLLWAKKIIEKHKLADRVIFAMPTIFTSNSISGDIEGSSVYHSKININNDLFGINIFLNKTFTNPITVTTIDQLLFSLTHMKEYQFISTYNLYNSCVIIDEVDFYDEHVLHNIKTLINKLIPLGVKFLIMSATLPDKFVEFFGNNFNVSGIISDTTKNNDIKVKFNSIVNYDINNISINIDKIKKYNKTIIYCNTVLSTKKMYNYLLSNNISVVLYNSHYINKDKIDIEKRILDNFGKNSTKNDYKVVIMSQIGELSINISSDYMISEICPFDRLVQRLGRLNRFNNNVGEIDVLVPYKDTNEHPYPYTQGYRNGGVVKSRYLVNTEYKLKNIIGKKISYLDLENIVNYIYKDFSNIPNNNIQNNNKSYNNTINNNAILSTYSNKYNSDSELLGDNVSVPDWISRDIFPTETVIVYDFKDNFNLTMKEYKNIFNKYSIQLPNYIINRNGDIFISKMINTGYNEIRIYILSSLDFYDNEKGFDISIYENRNNINHQIL